MPPPKKVPKSNVQSEGIKRFLEKKKAEEAAKGEYRKLFKKNFRLLCIKIIFLRLKFLLSMEVFRF